MRLSSFPHNNQRGLVLGMVILSALMFSAAAVAVLNLSATSSYTADRQANRLQARYAAEAGLVWAMQHLWVDDAYCGDPDPSPINGCTVNIEVTNCNDKNNRQIRATANCQ